MSCRVKRITFFEWNIRALYQLFSKCRTTQIIIMYVVIIQLAISTFTLGIFAEVVKNLINYMFNTNAYDNSLRPALNQTLPTDASVLPFDKYKQRLTWRLNWRPNFSHKTLKNFEYTNLHCRRTRCGSRTLSQNLDNSGPSSIVI